MVSLIPLMSWAERDKCDLAMYRRAEDMLNKTEEEEPEF
jgi:hypothetical protein